MGLVAGEESTDCLDPPAAPDEIGRLGPYRILSLLGRGGMGQVFKAEDTRLERTIALKVMYKKQATTSARRQRFVHEARAMAAINHDNVVTVYEVSERNGIPFLAMELLKGQPLDVMIKRGPRLKAEQVFEYAIGIASGLAAAHARGIIHRDIKPANIWVEEPTDRIKILDFGLAVGNGPSETLTTRGAVVGTPGYLSPEQSQSEPLDDRSDLYSVGVVLYELCSGRLPFVAKSIPELLIKIVAHNPQRLDSLVPDLPQPYADLIMRLLEKDPKDRVRSAADLKRLVAEATAAVRDESQAALPIVIQEPPPARLKDSKPKQTTIRSVSHRRKWTIATAVSASVLLLVGSWWFTRGESTASVPMATPAEVKQPKVSPASLKPLKIEQVLASSEAITQGNVARFKLRLDNTAKDGASDPRVINARANDIAQIRTVVQRDGETRRDPRAFPKRFTSKQLPAPGQSNVIEIQFDTAGMVPSSYSVHFELQSPDGKLVQQVSAPLLVAENLETADLLGFEVIRTTMGQGADTSLTEKDSGDMGGRAYLEVHMPRGNEAIPSPAVHTYLRFDLTTRLKSDSSIDRAIILLNLTSDGFRGSATINAYGLPEDFPSDWVEKGDNHLTWSQSPSAQGIEALPLLGQVVIDNVGGLAERRSVPYRVFSDALDNYVRQSTNYCSILLVRSTPGDKPTRLVSREGNMSQAPALAIRAIASKTN